MIKKMMKTILFFCPVVFAIFMGGDWLLQSREINKFFKNANGIRVTYGNEKLKVDIIEKSIGEKTHYTIKMIATDTTVIGDYSFSIDWDMFGGGMIAAIDLNEDGEQEIVAWGIHEQKHSFYLDFNDKKITLLPYEKIPDDLKILFLKWHKINIMKPLEISVLAILLTLYYTTLAAVIFVRWLIKRRHHKTNC